MFSSLSLKSFAKRLFILMCAPCAAIGLGCAASLEFKPPLARAKPAPAPDASSWSVDDPMARPAGAKQRNPDRYDPAATRPSGPLQMADAPAIDAIIRATKAEQVEMVRMLQPVAGTSIYFGHALGAPPAKGKPPRTTPIIATRESNRWKAQPIADARAADTTWAYVGAGPQRGHAWGVLENASDAPGLTSSNHLLLVRSTDSGATWRVVPLLKPSPAARYDSMCMSPYRGRVTLYQPPGEPSARAGFYHYQTSDDGATWSTPTFEPDSMTAADPVGEDDQPRWRTDPPARAADAK